VYVQFNHVANKDEETLDAFTKRLFAFVEQHAVDRFILDLRLNRGGNGQLNRCLLLGIIRSSIDRKGRLFTIIGRGTWSAAQFLVGDLEKYTNTVFVGEPTGGKPNSYGDSHKIVLPKSGIAVRVSTLWWQGDERDKRQWVAPQIATALSFQEYRSNADPALNAVLNYVPRKPLSELLTIALSDGGWTRASAAYAAWKADPANAHAEVEEELNTLGYQLLRSRRTEEAIGIFTLNVDGHPESANAYDSLGEAYTIAGQREPAIKACQRSLELDPKNEHAQAMLRQLQER
jgi:tetratricopeptide (TPR) repeat protein